MDSRQLKNIINLGESEKTEFKSSFNNELIEKYGSGIQRIVNYFKEAGQPIPDFRNISDGFMVTVFSDIRDKVTDKVTDNQQKILDLIKKDNTISTKEISDNIKISQRKVKENIAKLKEKGMINRIGETKTGHWEIVD